jgi:hypothetical protein
MGLRISMTKQPSSLKSNKQRALEAQQAQYEAQMQQRSGYNDEYEQ